MQSIGIGVASTRAYVENGCDFLPPTASRSEGNRTASGQYPPSTGQKRLIMVWLEQVDHLLAGDTTHLGKPSAPVLPVVDGEHGHRSVEASYLGTEGPPAAARIAGADPAGRLAIISAEGSTCYEGLIAGS